MYLGSVEDHMLSTPGGLFTDPACMGPCFSQKSHLGFGAYCVRVLSSWSGQGPYHEAQVRSQKRDDVEI